MPDSFYIGYVDRVPAGARKLLVWMLPLLAVLLVASGILLVRAQQFDVSKFEFGDVRSFEGTFRSLPYPHLLSPVGEVVLLVGKGKHEADLGEVAGLEPGSGLRLRGTRILRGNTVMVELEPGSAELTGVTEFQSLPVRGLTTELRGEIVGSKCFLGVMNPARGPVHAACARHCILGGVPPMLHPSGDDTVDPILITGLERPALVRMAAQPVAISGTRWSLPGLEWIEVATVERTSP